MHTRVGDLEKDVLHNVAAVGALELELVALEQDIVEAPNGSRENSVQTTFTLLDLHDEVDSTLASVTGGPRLAGHGVRRVTVGTQTLAVNPSLGDGISGLLLGETHHLGDDGGGRNLDQHNVVQADLIEGVLEGQNALDFVGLDHSLQNVADLQDLAVAQVAARTVGAGDPVSHGQNTTEVVGGVTPLSSEPAVVVVEPADHGADIESTIDGVQLVRSTRHTGTVGNSSALNHGAEKLGALLELQGLQTATQSVEED